jgi:kinesin family member 2/24
VNELERLASAELMNGNLEGNRDVYICAFELVGKEAFGKDSCCPVCHQTIGGSQERLFNSDNPTDLLNDRRKIAVMEDAFGESQLVGAVEEKPTSAEELISHIERSMSFRKSAPTVKNDRSSRSHAVCRIRIVNKDVIDAPDGLLFLVDLAGSEVDRDIKEHSKDRMKETRDINVSLSTLKDCIRGRAMWNMTDGVAANKRAMNVHVPFRSSVLTKVLKHVFDVKGDRYCKTAVLACVKPNAADAGPSKNTLRYAELLRVSVPKTKPASYNVNIPSTWSHHDLTEWIEKNVNYSISNMKILCLQYFYSLEAQQYPPRYSPQPKAGCNFASFRKASSSLAVSRPQRSPRNTLAPSMTSCGDCTSTHAQLEALLPPISTQP